ncbi:ANTAR domain-containing protein [Streptomyces sp. NPDC056486]|uniref:ANTAR domain-containing protein n=1 Tax=Streptomyces sp. NPDC056486 TaxID=3345835 RepID=UPI0036CFB5AA
MSREEKITRTFVELADTLADDFDVIDFVQQLAFRCCDVLDIAAAAVLLASSEKQLYNPVARGTDTPRAAVLDMAVLDMAVREGPAVDAHRTATAVTPRYLSSAPSVWHDFTFQARATGYTYAGAVPLRLRQENLGSLLLLRTGHDPLPDADLALAQAFADAAAIGLLHARAFRQTDTLNEQLRTALHSRILIEQAKGFLAARRGISPAEAFETLRHRARHHRVRLATVAQEVIAVRDLPEAPPVARDPGRDAPAT